MSSPTPPRFRRLLPDACDDFDLVAGYAYPDGLSAPWLRANMVTSTDGAAWGPSQRSRDLSGPADRALMGVLRGLADVVLTGAGTARAERYRPVRPREVWDRLRTGRPATPRIAVVTRGLDLEPELLRDAPDDARTIVFTTENSPRERRIAAAEHADVVVAGEESVEPAAVLAALGDRGLHRVLTEGGPRLLGELTGANLLDELCLTMSPTLAGPGADRIVTGGPRPEVQRMCLAALAEAEGSLFLRYTRP
ncbi:pyrimidine reductase family protein [Nocardiopsis ansamitocini]|nr:pyrimidine reductase family protein [Nocardiopsis ansamitocini]